MDDSGRMETSNVACDGFSVANRTSMGPETEASAAVDVPAWRRLVQGLNQGVYVKGTHRTSIVQTHLLEQDHPGTFSEAVFRLHAVHRVESLWMVASER